LDTQDTGRRQIKTKKHTTPKSKKMTPRIPSKTRVNSSAREG